MERKINQEKSVHYSCEYETNATSLKTLSENQIGQHLDQEKKITMVFIPPRDKIISDH